MTMAVEPYINRIHSTMDSDVLIGFIAESLVQLKIGEQFAVVLLNTDSGRFDPAVVHNMSDHQIDQCSVWVQQQFPFENARLMYAEDGVPVLCGSLVFESRPYGVLMIPLLSRESRPKIPDGTEFLLQAIGSALVKSRIYEDFLRRNEVFRVKIEAINRIAELLRNRRLDELLAGLLEACLGIMNAEVGAILLREKDGSLTSYTEFGVSGEFLQTIRDDSGSMYVEKVIRLAKPVLVEDVRATSEIDQSTVPAGLQSMICLPLFTRTNQLGVIVILNPTSRFEQVDHDVFCTIGFLASVAIENACLRIEQEKSDRTREQMKLAHDIQQNMQARCIPQVAEFDMHGWCIPCDETCGDYYDFIQLGSGDLGVIVGDATGHGVAAALTMVAVRASLLSMLNLQYPLPEVFRHVNNHIEKDGNSDRFMTLFCGILNPGQMSLSYCSAGHDSPLLYRPGSDEIIEFEPTGIPIGMLADWDYELREGVQLQKDDILVITTDGVCEAFNMDDEVFGIDRVKQLLRSCRGCSAEQVSTRFRDAVLEFIHPAPRSDDITVMVIVAR